MKTSKKLFSGLFAMMIIGLVGVSSVSAADTIGTVTGNDGDVKDLVEMQAEVIAVDGSEVTFKDIETGQEYEAGFGPSWFTKAYEAGEQIKIEGVETVADNDHGHNFQVMKVDDKVLREAFEGGPVWAGAGGEGKGQGGEGQGMGRGEGSGAGEGAGTGSGEGKGQGQARASYQDANGDGTCDNLDS